MSRRIYRNTVNLRRDYLRILRMDPEWVRFGLITAREQGVERAES